MFKISELYIYPIKSLSGIKVNAAVITSRGFQYDRRWMLIDKNNRFISQREVPKMAILKIGITDKGLIVTEDAHQSSLFIPFIPLTNQFEQVIIWDDICVGQLVSAEADNWFSRTLDLDCRLVYMPDDTERPTDSRYTPDTSVTSFSDAYPFMMIGQASLNDLNSRLAEPVSIDRFRPNIVFSGGLPFEEDVMKSIAINGIDFSGVKLCARCVMITINQNNALKGKEPTKTLAKYRSKNNKIYFGQNLISDGSGIITVGNDLTVLAKHTEDRFIV